MHCRPTDHSRSTFKQIGELVTKRIALLGATAVLGFSFAMAAIAVARPSRQRHHAGRAHRAVGQPDQVIQWNQELQKVLVAPGAQPSSIHPTRTIAITQIAVYDAVNGILRGGEPLVVGAHGPRGASPDAAAAAAAHTTLDAL